MNNLYLSAKELQAVNLLVSGFSYSYVAKKLNIDRTTLWNWKQKPQFAAYYNSLIKELKEHTKDKLTSLYDNALQTIENCLYSENDSIKLKTSLYIIDKIENTQYGLTIMTKEIDLNYNQVVFILT